MQGLFDDLISQLDHRQRHSRKSICNNTMARETRPLLDTLLCNVLWTTFMRDKMRRSVWCEELHPAISIESVLCPEKCLKIVNQRIEDEAELSFLCFTVHARIITTVATNKIYQYFVCQLGKIKSFSQLEIHAFMSEAFCVEYWSRMSFYLTPYCCTTGLLCFSKEYYLVSVGLFVLYTKLKK